MQFTTTIIIIIIAPFCGKEPHRACVDPAFCALPREAQTDLLFEFKNATWLGLMKGVSGRFGRWVLRLADFNAEVAST